ncbi:nucleotidyl transferase AbiEii/AbiGii toxin family protein [Pedobacter sp. KBS0701]|uniref:nucleotidyl transferase AbiEii/AbiGii toxin family protein n=2 Tax=unclassified Pedobacter TaxID=2628915 RepID=UPI00110DF6B0|nr:nucleotidyl transferase AbiEii/AbiGii toxin family protein [Pedobacter sp. KBS0701]QDW25700.1 nucleotidyl transferase AbiEii/AbiGii toxin family protein [Pedobacter sp. KBS0701]
MAANFLHNHKNFPDLLRILEDEMGIQAGLIEKDYWIMHVLYGLKNQDFQFELKGGTSLSKGFKIIERFSEDIDIHIKPPAKFNINENPKNNKPKNTEAKKNFYDWLAKEIAINGVISVERDSAFDNATTYNSAGIRLNYKSFNPLISGIKEGILLETGFDTVTPNTNITISSWAYDKAIENKIEIIDNRAKDISCYNPGYTFVEKLQTIATKFRKEKETGDTGVNFMRQYYDLYSLLDNNSVQEFIGTDEYYTHKKNRFPSVDFDIPIYENEAFLLKNDKIRKSFIQRYKNTASLYYNRQPDFEELLDRIKNYIDRL